MAHGIHAAVYEGSPSLGCGRTCAEAAFFANADEQAMIVAAGLAHSHYCRCRACLSSHSLFTIELWRWRAVFSVEWFGDGGGAFSRRFEIAILSCGRIPIRSA